MGLQILLSIKTGKKLKSVGLQKFANKIVKKSQKIVRANFLKRS
jgi:hypothetical protein